MVGGMDGARDGEREGAKERVYAYGLKVVL
jgi:hypothetical protein